MNTCIVEGCLRTYLAKGFCSFHYKRYRFGRPLDAGPRYKSPLPKHHPVYMAWVNMKTRCENPTHEAYPYYGGRGITYCARWKVFINFYKDMFPTWERGLSLDRQRNNENYEPCNCR